ncbi:rod shape-determining protein MreC [Pseudoroseomonas globiformis]|uniref:Cell shape-determining protein MreC n=1 Tax=Teichococcus globiformis TaxID=2307229 RepID=A0ABV7G0Y6_9PROT
MIRLSIPLRQALSRLSLPVLIAAALGTALLGKADIQIVERLRMAVADTLAPIYGLAAQPVTAVRETWQSLGEWRDMRAENARLREENDRLHRWQAAALSLQAENTLLRRQLGYLPEAPARYHTARVVADAGGTYAQAVLLAVPPGSALRKGQVALDDRGLAGRVTELGSRSARVLLVTDMNSRIPVTLEGSRARAILAGTNTARPRLEHMPADTQPREGERVVTSAEAGVFPAGLPVGIVRRSANGAQEVELFARLDRLDMLRIFDFGLTGILPPEAVARPEPRPRR